MKGEMKTKGFLTALIVGMCLLHTNLYGQWPKPADYQWNLNNIKPYFDTVKLDLEVVEWSNGSFMNLVMFNKLLYKSSWATYKKPTAQTAHLVFADTQSQR